MKKILTLLLIFSLSSCSDGDFDVPSFEFTDTVTSCGEYVLYVTNSGKTELLALSLVKTHLGTTVGEKTIALGASAATTSIKATYRILDSEFGTDYFCQNIPPTEPKVTKELIATSGNVTIITTQVLTGTAITGYKYEISLSELLFFDGTDRVYFETFPYGSITIKV
jgi:hypothetical protein